VTLTATVAPNAQVTAEWFNASGAKICRDGLTCSIVLNADMSITARFPPG